MPADCIRAYIVVGPTKRKPSLRRALLIATDSGVTAGTSANDPGRERSRGGANDHKRASRSPSTISWTRRALEIVASIFARLRMMPASRHQPFDVVGVEGRDDDRRIESGEHLAEARALAQDRDPGQSRLEAFQRHLLEECAVAVQRPAPLLVVVAQIFRVVTRPGAPGDAVFAEPDVGTHPARIGARSDSSHQGVSTTWPALPRATCSCAAGASANG